MFLRAFLLLFLLGCSVSHAALFSDSEAREQVEALRTKVMEIEARMNRTEEALMGQALIELHTQAEALREELGKLRGQIEVLQDENRLLRKQQKDFYLDLDGRLRQLEPDSADVPSLDTTSPVPQSDQSSAVMKDTAPEKTAAVLQLPDAAQRSSYDAAYASFKGGDYSSAISGFESFLVQYPQSALAPAAAYWIGNAYYALRDFEKAITSQQRLTETYPGSSKVPDGLLNMASSQVEMGQKAIARKTLENIIIRYPDSEAAGKARHRLGLLK